MFSSSVNSVDDVAFRDVSKTASTFALLKQPSLLRRLRDLSALHTGNYNIPDNVVLEWFVRNAPFV